MTKEDKIKFIQNNIGETRVKWNGDEATMEKTYRNVRNAIHKKEKKVETKSPKLSISDLFSQVETVDEINKMKEDFDNAIKAHLQAIREQRRMKLENDIKMLEERLKTAKKELSELDK